MLSGPHLERGAELTVTFDWMGAEVAIITPGDAAGGQPFDISFSIDMSTLPPGDTFAFKTYLDASDTIDISGATWEYTFISDEAPWNFSISGVLGDITTDDARRHRLFNAAVRSDQWELHLALV